MNPSDPCGSSGDQIAIRDLAIKSGAVVHYPGHEAPQRAQHLILPAEIAELARQNNVATPHPLWLITYPGRAISRKRIAFMRFVDQSLPNTRRFIAAFRLWARIVKAHHAALVPNRPDGN